jgi:pimeloyl-ACP methyl ester carboxylesterase
MTYDPVINAGDGLAARIRGTEGEGVLWLHPYALDSTCWTDLWDRLPDWRHVAVDLPGHGLSPPVAPDADLGAVARKLNTLAVKHGVRHLVGLSFGSFVALQMALEAEASYARIILGSPLIEHGANDELLWKRYREMVTMYAMAGHGDHLRGRLMLVEPSPFGGVATQDELYKKLYDIVGRHSFADLAYGGLQRWGNHPQSDVRLHALESSVLLIRGQNEGAAAKRYSDRLSRTFRHCRSVYIIGVGSLSLIERPEQAAGVIESHLRSEDASPATTSRGAG